MPTTGLAVAQSRYCALQPGGRVPSLSSVVALRYALSLLVLASVVTSTSARPVAQDAVMRWYLRDPDGDGASGAGVARAFRELLVTRRPQRAVTVAIIDVGIDTTHPYLRPHLWTNPHDSTRNGIDDDRDGYVDDVHGWNFLGGPDGRNVDRSTLEVTRLYARCMALPWGVSSARTSATLLAPGLPACRIIFADYIQQRETEQRRVDRRMRLLDSLADAITVLSPMLGRDSLSVARVANFEATSAAMNAAQTAIRRASEQFGSLRSLRTLTPSTVDSMRLTVMRLSSLSGGLDTSFKERSIVGDRVMDTKDGSYGNRDIMGAGAAHGTHLAGIVRTIVSNGLPVGAAPDSVALMMIRATTDGDERDKDIANAIHFAVDHGASIISMSFGKPYSPEKHLVDEAVRYADRHGVLMVHSAGNDAIDLDRASSYPSPVYLTDERAASWIEVGASGPRADAQLAAGFSNYGHERVDIFAPGVDIRSTALGGGYESRSGTSQAAPMVAGVAALLMVYNARLTARDVRRLLLASAVTYPGLMVRRPGGAARDLLPFALMSSSGGVVNAFNAFQMTFATQQRPQTGAR